MLIFNAVFSMFIFDVDFQCSFFLFCFFFRLYFFQNILCLNYFSLFFNYVNYTNINYNFFSFFSVLIAYIFRFFPFLILFFSKTNIFYYDNTVPP